MPSNKLNRRNLFLILIFLLFFGFILLALLIPSVENLTSPALREGEVAPYDINAPYDISYQSQVITNRQQEIDAAEVPPVYSPADTNIARQQLEHLRNTLAFINSIRGDNYASMEQKITDLAALEDIQLSRDMIRYILSLSDSRWESISQETTSILDQIMREPIRDDQRNAMDLKIPTLISLSFPEDQSTIITSLVRAFIVPNSLYNEQLTEAARLQARSNISPVTRSVFLLPRAKDDRLDDDGFHPGKKRGSQAHIGFADPIIG